MFSVDDPVGGGKEISTVNWEKFLQLTVVIYGTMANGEL